MLIKSTETTKRAPVNARHEARTVRSRKRLYVCSLGETTYYGPVLQHIVTHINERVPHMKLYTSCISDAISGNTRKKNQYKGILPSRIYPANENDWERAAEGPNKIYVP
jgi:hypothetical protein